MTSEYLKLCRYSAQPPLNDEQLIEKINIALNRVVHLQNDPTEKFQSTDELVIEEIIMQYRKKLAEAPPDQLILKSINTGEPKKAIKKMAYLESVVRCHQHAGFPVEESPFNDPDYKLEIIHKYLSNVGQKFEFIIRKAIPHSKRTEVVCSVMFGENGKPFFKGKVPTEERKERSLYAGASLLLKEHVSKCRQLREEALQFVIQGVYYKDGKKTTTLLKRIEVWNLMHGYKTSAFTQVYAWAEESNDATNPDVIGNEELLSEPFTSRGPLPKVDNLSFIMRLSSPEDLDSEAKHDFNKNPGAYRCAGENVVADNVLTYSGNLKNYLDYLENMKNVLLLPKVIYEPASCQTMTDVRCIVCNTSFATIPALLSHLYVMYPALTFKIQKGNIIVPSGKREDGIKIDGWETDACFIKITAVSPEAGQLFREDLKGIIDPRKPKPNDFDNIMLRALCATELFTLEKDSNMYAVVYAKQSKILCHDCKLSSRHWENYRKELDDLYHIMTNAEIPFDEKIFFCLLKSFMAKSFCRGIRSRGVYQFLRIFIEAYQPAIAYNYYNFTTQFRLLLAGSSEKKENSGIFKAVFGDEKITDLQKFDLYQRCGLPGYKFSTHGTWFIDRVWLMKKQLDSETGPEYNLLKEIVSRDKPDSRQERRAVFRRIANDPFSREQTKIGELVEPFTDEKGIDLWLPRCIFFGSRRDEEMADSHAEYYQN